MSLRDEIPLVPAGTLVGCFGGFAVLVVRKGQGCGPHRYPIHDRHDPLVEFYALRSANRPGFTVFGQFVASYALSTLVESDGPRIHGLDLCGHDPVWKIGAQDLERALVAVDDFLRMPER